MLHVPRLAIADSLVELESSSFEHGEWSWWSSNWMTEVAAKEIETLATVQSFLKMLEREHQRAAVQELSSLTRQKAQLRVSSEDSRDAVCQGRSS